jgi:type I restriction enzyme M protein
MLRQTRKIVVSSPPPLEHGLEEWKLFNSNLDVVDDAFEYLVNQSAKGEKGQYFTPRWVIDMCVKMLNPQEDETFIDTAAGSAGFPVHAIFHVWRQILIDEGLPISHLFTLEKKPERCYDYARNKVFAIDFDEKSARIARCLNLIAGDGQTNVIHLNTLDWTKWNETIKEQAWLDTYNEGWKKLRRLLTNPRKQDYRAFTFDILMANPPFAGEIKQPDMLAPYELARKANGKLENQMGRDLLFIERNLDFLRLGGRMAIVLPQGRFNNTSEQRIREFIAEHCRILAVVGLHPNTGFVRDRCCWRIGSLYLKGLFDSRLFHAIIKPPASRSDHGASPVSHRPSSRRDRPCGARRLSHRQPVYDDAGRPGRHLHQ